ncbi:MAG: DNA mismatch repair endonuclease MutL [Bacteroidales bacterium]|nr:DNA mismatch repair endonuclease MutL [Bacteroidales bacterium]
MGKLKVLPAQVSNMIAAGEVVQRPASVVKELMENAVDAGATQVTVVIADAGRTLIQVIDNGSGMSPSDAVLCFERHATSKISSAEDLNAIDSYGFRGEALASIAAVAEVTLKTRRAADETATQVVISGGGSVKTSSVAAPTGSNFAVRNLFYNTPARRKFLKSDNVELKHIVDEFTRVALTRPDVGFSLSSNGRDLFVMRPAKSLKFRILDLMGSSVASDLADLSAETTVASISGFVGKPESARKTVGNQYFFVNGRYFRSPYLHKAVIKAYEEFIPEGLTPSYFIWLQVDPHSVDVNISPTKSEVKFEEDNVIFQILYACVKETLGRNAYGRGIDFDAAQSIQMPHIGKHYEDVHGPVTAPALKLDTDYDPFAVNLGFETHSGEAPAPQQYNPRSQSAEKLFEEKFQPNALVVKGKYIVSPVASGLLVVNIRRAAERIVYERTLKALSRSEHVTQQALFPVSVQVGPAARLLFDDKAPQLSAVGFDITGFGNDTVVVNGVPEGFSCEPGKVQQMVQDLTLILSDDTGGLSDRVNASIAAKIATLGSLNADVPTTSAQAQTFINALFACENSELTPSGRRIMTIVSTEELEKKF